MLGTFISLTSGRVGALCGMCTLCIVSGIKVRNSKLLLCHEAEISIPYDSGLFVLLLWLLSGIPMCLICANTVFPLECEVFS